jgi:hypothetical protein
MRRILWLVPVFVLALATAASAQAAPTGAPDDGMGWKGSVWAVILAGFIIAASIKKSKREHRD